LTTEHVSSALTMSVSSFSDSYCGRASAKLDEAKRQLRHLHFDTSVSASQESVEFSVESIFLMFRSDHEPQREMSEEELRGICSSIPPAIGYVNLPRILLLRRFWRHFRRLAMYGDEKLRVGADRLFTQDEANLALKHAEEAYGAARTLRDWILTQKK